MAIKYSQEIDRKWQKYWEENGTYRFDEQSDKPKLYLMEMFSYPSGSNLHMGHWWNYSLPDSWGRMKRMQGFNVFHPTGFDAFGLPAENFAIKTGIHPKDSTLKNIATMERQLRELGSTYDWTYEVKTCMPDYYKWTQWLFLQLYKHGLAYKKESPVNWCTGCQTVIANEQVIDGTCERCHSTVVRKNMMQWCFRTTAYAEELLSCLEGLDWPEKTKAIQRNWIGKSVGAEVSFDTSVEGVRLTVFTTRVDTLMGLSYLVVAPEHADVLRLTTPDCLAAVEAYREKTAAMDEVTRTFTNQEKTGVFTGSYAVHPLTGARVPIWISDYVIASYGTGAVMAVPAHDERDFAFATKFDLPITQVIDSKKGGAELPYCDYNGVLVNSGKYTGLSTKDAKRAIVEDLKACGMGKDTTTYRLRDWSVSRQRYWGAPIPMVYCPHCGDVPVPESQLPVELPYDVEFKPNGKSPLSQCDSFRHTTCPKCGAPAERDTDTLDTFVCSSWYFLRYFDNQNSEKPFDFAKQEKYMPVDMYVGGVEHAAMHLLYARFIQKALRDMGFVTHDEPFTRLRHQGIILGADGEKMSKSRGNTVAPDEYVTKYGADIFRSYLAFGFSYSDGGPWNADGIEGMSKYFGRVTRMVENTMARTDDKPYAEDADLEYVRHNTIKSVTTDVDNFQFNTAMARLMEFTSAIGAYQQKADRVAAYERAVVSDFLKLFCIFAPHFGEELWQAMGYDTTIFDAAWPTFDAKKMVRATTTLAVQVNGSVRDKISVPTESGEEEIRAAALASEKVAKCIEGKEIRRVIVIRGRLVNIVVG